MLKIILKEIIDDINRIRYYFGLVVKIQLECKTQYSLIGRKGSSTTGQFDQDINNGAPAKELAKCSYKCFRHCLTDALEKNHRQVAGLVFTLPCQPNGGAAKNGTCLTNGATSGTNGFVEIPVCVVDEGEANCMGDVYVYFYACNSGVTESCTVGTDRTSSGSSSCSPKNGGSETDTVPLMVRFNGHFYKPCSRDLYFTKWVCVSALAGVAAKSGCKCPCCPTGVGDPATSCGTGAGAGCTDVAGCGTDCACCKELVEALNAVNESLNRIDLDKSSLANCSSGSSNGKGYGLPEQCKDGGVRGCKLQDTVGNYRICLTENKPKNGADKAYTRIVHRTTNGFKIGCITYCGQDFATNGITPAPENGKLCPSNSDSGDAQTCNGGLGVGAACSAAGSPSNGTKITVANGTTVNGNKNHTELLKTCNWNTVVVYYSCTDTCRWLPQLIVILHTAEVKNGQAVTAGNGNKKYGYYLLSNGGRGIDGHRFEYKWVDVNGTAGEAGKAGVTLDEKTDFSLLNSAVILLEGKAHSCCTYGEDQICQALKTATSVRSPGNTNDVNRLKNRDITVKDESEKGTCASADASGSPGTCCCKCLTDAGFKLMTHNIENLVTLNGKFKEPLCNVNLITGLKFLIPTCNKGEYKQLTLNGAAGANGSTDANIKYHNPKNGNKICVYFYGCDPRPLFLCYNGWAYRANSKDDYDCQKWAACTDAAKCGCTGPTAGTCGCTQEPGTCQCTQGKSDQCPLLKALVEVSDFLNPVDINVVSTCSQPCKCYCIHRFNGQRVWIRVSAQFACGPFCYNRFTHTHAGIRGKGDGFRLGNIHYNLITGKNCVTNGSSTCIKLNGTNSGGNGCINSVITNGGKSSGKPCETASHVAVFYYKLDSEHKTPIVVALCSNGTTGSSTCDKLDCKLYYVLKESTGKIYTKGTNGLTMDKDDELSKQLDDALFKNTKKLQIVLSTRPVEIDYKAEQDQTCTSEKAEAVKSEGADKEDLQKVKYLVTCKYKVLDHIAKTAEADPTRKFHDPVAFRAALMHHVQGSTEYKAQLCDKNGASEPSSSSPSTNQIDVKVQEVTCDKSYSEGGYRCFKHGLTTAKDIAQVGGLVLCIWVKEGPGKGANGKCEPCPKPGPEGGGQKGITLCDGQATSNGNNGKTCQNGQNGKTGQQVQLSYTTCKGDLYVFFYDQDPRPLLLCYNGEAYRPVCMADYCQKWYKVNNGDKKCVENGQVKADQSILNALFEVSMFLNPVYLVLCSDAYGKLDPKHGQESQPEGQQEQNGASGQNGHQQPEQDKHHSYPIDRNPPQNVCLRVTGRDLRCYREYVHRPEKQGFRLGEVRYVKAAEGGGKPGASGPTCSSTDTGGASTTCSPSGPSTANTGPCSANTATSGAAGGQQCPQSAAGPSAPASTSPFCFDYDCKKQLQTVSMYYYMYDGCHNWPLVAVLSYKGQSSEFFRLCCPGTTSTENGAPSQGACQGSEGAGDTSGGGTCQSGSDVQNGNGQQKCVSKKVDPRCLKWVKMGAESGGKGAGGNDSCANGQGAANGKGTVKEGACQPCADGGGSGTSVNSNGRAAASTSAESADMCQEDAEFVQRAKELYRSVHAWDVPSSVYMEDKLPLTRELSDLVEGRAYQIRKSLQIDYKTDEKCLILATASHCWEEWPLAYIVGGGALSVAAGGSWKFVVMAVGVFIKL
ncbi:hypothetical protein MACJ_002403 [Theileria orientalis]|uniref:Uncharacterized protein n=1 Tax=Theileria orientalis TaxID=68886 RepID=A0A976M634_THEOR|nr:hypothetical protein MACJ_002403 [Theileria orientalis]